MKTKANALITVFAKNLKKLMHRDGYTQSELARRLGVKPQTVQKWVAAKSTPRSQSLIKLAKVLKTEPGNLIQRQPRNGKATKANQPETESVDRLLTNPTVTVLSDHQLLKLLFNIPKLPACIRQLAKRLNHALEEIASLRKQLNLN